MQWVRQRCIGPVINGGKLDCDRQAGPSILHHEKWPRPVHNAYSLLRIGWFHHSISHPLLQRPISSEYALSQLTGLCWELRRREVRRVSTKQTEHQRQNNLHFWTVQALVYNFLRLPRIVWYKFSIVNKLTLSLWNKKII